MTLLQGNQYQRALTRIRAQVARQLVFLIGLFTFSGAVATNIDPLAKIDSLQQVLSRASEDTARVDLYVAIAKTYAIVQPDSAFSFLQKALLLSQKIDYTIGMALSQVELGYMEGKYGNQDQATIYLKAALPLVQQTQDSTLLWDTYQQIGWIYKRKGQHALALQYCQKALAITIETRDSLHIASMKQNIGAIFFDMKDYDQAIAMLEQALSVYQDFNHYLPATTICNNLANVYATKNDYNQALRYYQQAVKEARSGGDKVFEANILSNIAQMYVSQQQYKTALSYAQQAQTIWKHMSTKKKADYNFEFENTMGDIYLGIQQYALARKHYESAFNFMKERGDFSSYLSTYTGLIRLDSLTGNYQQAFLHQQALTALKDSLASIERIKAVEKLKVQYETEQKDQEIILLQEQSTRQQLEARQQKLIKNSFIAGSFALCLLLGLGYNRYQFKQKALRVMGEQKAEILMQKQQVERKNEENKLLLKEIHHRVKNNLQIVLSILNAQADSLQDQKAIGAVLESQHRVHSMALIHQNLYQSDNLNQIQAQQYLQEMVETVYSSYHQVGQPVRLQLNIEDLSLNMSTAVPVGLIVTELVTNACKHAFTKAEGELTVSLKADTSSQYRLTVADNGPGLPADFDINQAHSLGLQLVYGLTQQLDGELLIENHAGAHFDLLFRAAA